MKTIIFVTLCFLLCRYIKPKWKAFLVGIVGYLIISFITSGNTISAGSNLYETTSTISYLLGKALGEFLWYFILGLAIFLIFDKLKKTDRVIIESSTPDDESDIPSK